jgi:hypothetical protein
LLLIRTASSTASYTSARVVLLCWRPGKYTTTGDGGGEGEGEGKTTTCDATACAAEAAAAAAKAALAAAAEGLVGTVTVKPRAAGV